tara:strand:+ start:777 stop:1400 length:624 start_codon:yes stop_codon:yes gene_type:complete
MAISYPLTLPSHVKPSSITFRAVNTVGMSMSPFTYQQQVIAHAGQRWECDVTLPAMSRADAEQWVAFLVSLRGRFGTFTLGDPVSASPRGSAGGTPLVNGASQTGVTLNIDGCTASQTGWLKAGDYIQLGTGGSATLHKVLADADSNGSGEVSLDLWPFIRTAPSDNASVVVTNTVGQFRLASNEQNWNINEASIYGITFGAVEAIT